MTEEQPLLPVPPAEREAKLIELRRAHFSVALVEQSRRIRRAEKQLEKLRGEETKLLVEGRRTGLSWADLAGAAGVTRQAVQQRVNPLLGPAGEDR
jgi:hypothetical protein